LLSSLFAVSYLRDSVGDAIEGQLGGSWADGGVGSVDFGGVVDGLVALLEGRGRGGGHEGSKGDDGELHFEVGGFGINYFSK